MDRRSSFLLVGLLLLSFASAGCGPSSNQDSRLKAAQEQADRLAREMQAREAGQADQAVAVAVAFGCVVGVVLLLQLLRRERGARLTLTRLLRWLQRRDRT